jgi:putative holliday junction resolvase
LFVKQVFALLDWCACLGVFDPANQKEFLSVVELTAVRLLGVDLGTKRIGIAVTDALGFGAHPRVTLTRARSRAEDIAAILSWAMREEVGAIVVGLPLGFEGNKNDWALQCERFAAALAAATPLPVHLHDEFLSSQEAHADLIAAGVSRKNRSAVIDQAAAVRILESYLRSL